MLFHVGRALEVEGVKGLLGTERFDKLNKYYQTQNREFFKTIDSETKFFGELAKFPNRSFGFVYLRPINFINQQSLLKARHLSTKGIIFNFHSLPEGLDRIIHKFSEIKRTNKKFDEVRAINDKIKEKYKAAKKVVKETNKDSREHNKAVEKEWKDANKVLEKAWKESKKKLREEYDDVLKDMTDVQKKVMPKEPEYEPEPDYAPEPEYIVLEKEPNQPNYRSEPRSLSIHIGENQLYKSCYLGWNILSYFKFYKIEGTSFGVLIKRDEQLKYTYDNLELLSIDDKMSRDDFLKFFDKNERNEKALDSYRPEISTNYHFMDLIAENNGTFSGEDWIFQEQIAEDDGEMLPALAPIKPMHAASILSAGMKFSKEIKTAEGNLLIKSAPVKVFTEKQKIVNGKRVTEVYQQQETKLAFYNLDRRELEVY